MRKTYSGISGVIGGCFECNGLIAMWFAKNTMGVAARHHDATGHTTWVDQTVSVIYGDKDAGLPQPEGAP